MPEDAAAEFLSEDGAPTPPRRSTGRGTSSSSERPRTPNSSAPFGTKFWDDGSVRTAARVRRRSRKALQAQKFRDYFEFSEPLENMPSHRVLAVMRGEKEQVLALTFDGGDDGHVPGDDRADASAST